MTDLATKIRNAAAFDIQDKASHELFEAMPQDTYRSMFAKGARYQHAQNAWAFEALLIALPILDEECYCHGETWDCESCEAKTKIAALVPSTQKGDHE